MKTVEKTESNEVIDTQEVENIANTKSSKFNLFFKKIYNLIFGFPSDDKPDIKYRGPFSYRVLRILGWLSMGLTAITFCSSVFYSEKFNVRAFGALNETWYLIFTYIGLAAAPLFIIASFSLIVNRKKTYRSMFIFYGLFIILIFLLYCLFFHRYVFSFCSEIFAMNPSSVEDFVLKKFSSKLYLNVFVDLLLVTAFQFFINYKPKTHFQGKNIIYFRLMAFIPVIYLIFSYCLKVLDQSDVITLPLNLYPFMITKTPLMHIAFFILILYMQKRENIYKQKGKTEEDYNAYLGTNRASLRFSIILSILFALFGLLDLIIMNIVFSSIKNPDIATLFIQWGVGSGFGLLYCIPLVFLFSFNRTHKKTGFDSVLPFIGIIFVALIYVEGFYEYSTGVARAVIEELGKVTSA